MTPFAPGGIITPYSASDAVAFTLALLAVLDAALWWRDRERGMASFALGFGLLSIWTFAYPWHTPTDQYFTKTPWHICSMSAMAALCVGMVDYMQVPRAHRSWVLGTLFLPLGAAAAIMVWVHVDDIKLPRAWLNLLGTLCMLGLTSLAFWGARHERGAGHGYVGVALLGTPAVALTAALSGNAQSMAFRYWGLLPFLVLGLTLLTVSLLRRRHALEAEVARRAQAEQALTLLNASLEDQVSHRTRDLQEMVDALESFNRNVSHDLRGPLGGIAQLAHMAQAQLQQGDSTLALRALPMISQQADTSIKMLGALLALARASHVHLQRAPVDLNALVREVRTQLDLAAPPGAPHPTVTVGDLPTIEADAEMLRPVFVNLLGNAFKFSRERANPQVAVQARQAGGQVVVSVADNGAGFDAEQASKLFTPFSRLHAQRFEGHGVGLTIVRRVIERHGGRAWAEGRPGLGATFYVSLPLT